MEPLLKAIQDLAEEYSFDRTLPSSCALLAKYVATGDEKLLPRLLKMDEGEINVIGQVGKAIARPDKFGDTDRRLLRFFARRSVALNGGEEDTSHGDLSDHPLPRCLESHLLDEQPNENLFGIILAELRLIGVEEARWRRLTARFVQALAKGKRLTSAGRYLLGLPAGQLAELMPRIKCNKNRDDFVAAFISEAPEILARVMDELVQQDKVRDFPFGGWLAALEANPARFESRAVAAFRLLDDKYREKSDLAMSLETHFPGKYRAEALKAVGDGLGWGHR